MQLAYYIAVHHNIEQFRWTFSAIYNEVDVFAIHVDRKAGEQFRDHVREIAAHNNVYLVPSQCLAWGGWSLCKAELVGLRILISASNDWSYFVNMSGQCYPIKPIEHIRNCLVRAWPQCFIHVAPFSKLDPDMPHLKRRIVFEFRGKIRGAGVYTTAKWKRLFWPKHPLVNWYGSAWHLLSRPFCEWILKVLTVDDWNTLANSPAFFARKFDCSKDYQIMHQLAEINGLNAPSMAS